MADTDVEIHFRNMFRHRVMFLDLLDRLCQIVGQVRVEIEMLLVAAPASREFEPGTVAPEFIEPAFPEGCGGDRFTSPAVGFRMRRQLLEVPEGRNFGPTQPQLIQGGEQWQTAHRNFVQ